MTRAPAEIIQEYGPFPDVEHVHGLTYDGQQVWFAAGDSLIGLDPESGETTRALDVPAHAGTAFDGRRLFQIADDRIQTVDPVSGEILGAIPTPAGGASGLAWAEGALWVAQYRARQIHQVDPDTGAILRTIACSRFVTGVTWVDGELWHGTLENETSDLRRIDPESGVRRPVGCVALPILIFRPGILIPTIRA